MFAGPTAGYLISWPIAAFVVGLLTERFWARYNLAWGMLANVVGGIVVIYLIGVPVLAAVANLSPRAAIVSGALPFLIGDLIKAVVAAAIAVQVRRSYPVIERPSGRPPSGEAPAGGRPRPVADPARGFELRGVGHAYGDRWCSPTSTCT